MGSSGAQHQPPPPGNPVADMESFQKSHGLNNEASEEKSTSSSWPSTQDKSGMVDINEFCRLLRVERSPFVERLFSMFDSDRTGTIDLKEFVVGLSNVGTEARENKVKFAFQVFDLDGSRVDRLVRAEEDRQGDQHGERESSSTGRWSGS